MRPSEALQKNRDNIRQIVLAHHVTNVRFFWLSIKRGRYRRK